jgi:hypothetical protein
VSKAISYGADPLLVGFWALICSPAGFVLFKAPAEGALVRRVWWIAFPLLPVIFASRFRATFTSREFVYRRWGPTIRVSYDDIRSIDVTNRTAIAKDAVGAFIVTKSGSRLPFWPKLFPRQAIDRFFALAPDSILQAYDID